jgi:hypothetical protein
LPKKKLGIKSLTALRPIKTATVCR